MLRKILVVILILMTVLCGIGVYSKWFSTGDRPVSTIGDKGNDIKASMLKPLPKEQPVPPVIKEINERNAKLKTFVCDDMEIRVWQGGHRHKLSGSMYYEKPTNFRMEISSILGKEVDIGSNSTAFWYWSRRDKSPGLHWAKHEDFQKTRLKTPFNPALLKSSLGQELLDVQSARIVENQKDMMLVYPQKSGQGTDILLSVFVNKERKQIDGFVVTDTNGKYLAACEIQSRQGDLPKTVLYTWYEEDRVMLMTFNNPRVNTVIGSDRWAMPNYTPKINIGEQ